jgi:hypothetical protein
VKASVCEILFSRDGNNALRKLATPLLILGVAVISCSITRWLTFRAFVTPDPDAEEGDPRFFTAGQHMLAAVFLGVIIVCVSRYCSNGAEKMKS